MADIADVHLKVPADLFARLYALERAGRGSVGQMIVDALEAAYPADQPQPEADTPPDEAAPETPPEQDAPAPE